MTDTLRMTHLARVRAERAAADNAASEMARALHLQLATLHWERVASIGERNTSTQPLPAGG